MARYFFRGLVGSLVALAPACGSDESPIAASGIHDGEGTDAAAGSGGKSGSGGSRAGGATGAGGSARGGATGAGGLSAGGSNAGGADAGAGGSNTDGGSGAGGALGSGGASSDGGIDGSSGSGGAITGGFTGSGGIGTGGASTGGASNDAGSSTVFVNPMTGNNDNSGLSSAQAVKSISKAAEIAHTLPSPRTILLEDGTYNQSTQLVLNASVPPATTVRSVSSAGVTLHGSSGGSAFVFEGGGALRNVTLDTWSQGVEVYGGGTFDMSDVHFVNVGDPLQFFESVVATVDAGVTGTFAVPPVTGFNSACVLAMGTSTVTFRNGVFQNVPGSSGQIFMAGGSAKLTIDNTLIDTSTVQAIFMFENAGVVLMNSQIHRVSLATAGTSSATIFMGGQGGVLPINQTLDVVGSDISQNQVPGVSLIVHSAFATTPVVKFTSSHVDNNTGSGFFVSSSASIHPSVVNTVQVIDSTFKGNTGSGITMPVGTVSITGGEFSGNGGDGIALTGTMHANSLKVRGPVKIDANEGDGISFTGAAGSSLDLGKTGDPGGITFNAVAVAHSAVNLNLALQGFAIGNTWMPNVQGATAGGLFSNPLTITGPATGLNATVVSGGSLVVAE